MTSLFGTPTPGSTATDAPNWTLGSRVEPKVAGNVSAIRWYMPTGITGSVGARLYDADSQALLASAAFGTVAAGWQSATFTPVDVTGVNLIAAVYTSTSGHYGFDAGIWPVENSDLLGTQGRFHASGDVFPENGSTACYYVDVVFTAAGAGSTATLDLTAPAATSTAAATSESAAALTTTALAATLTAASTSSSTGALALSALAATFTASGGPGSRPLVTRPDTGLVVRPFTGYVTRP